MGYEHTPLVNYIAENPGANERFCCMVNGKCWNSATGQCKANCGLIKGNLSIPDINSPYLKNAQKEGVTQYSTKKMEDITKTPQFKRWFGKSKVVNPDGTPKVVYSGHANIELYGNKHDPKETIRGWSLFYQHAGRCQRKQQREGLFTHLNNPRNSVQVFV